MLTPRVARAGAVLAAAALVLTACGAGQRAQTAVEVPVIDGVVASVGTIDLRNVTIATPPGGSYAQHGDADLQLYIVNNGVADKLVSVSSPAAASVAIYPNAAAAGAAASSTPADSAVPTDSSGSGDTSSPSASPSSSPSTSVDLASGELTSIGNGADQPAIVLHDLSQQLYPAMSVPIVFTFAQAGSVTVWVSVHLSTGEVTAPTLPITHSATSG